MASSRLTVGETSKELVRIFQERSSSIEDEENPNLASKADDVQHKDLWWKGPEWMGTPENWPPDIANRPSAERLDEARVTKEIFAGAKKAPIS